MSEKPLVIGIQADDIFGESYSKVYAEVLQKRGVTVRWVDLCANDALEQVRDCDGVMWRYGHIYEHKIVAPRVLYCIEKLLNIPVFPNWTTAWHYDNKLSQTYLMRAYGIPTPRTWVFWNAQSALEWAKDAPYPLVYKLSTGAGSMSVVKIENYAQAKRYIDLNFKRGAFQNRFHFELKKIKKRYLIERLRLFKRAWQAADYVLFDRYPPLPTEWPLPEFGYILFQEFVPGNLFDTRITVIGNRAFGFRRWNRTNDFRASGSGKLDHDASQIDLETVRLAYQVSRQAGFQCMSYDLLKKGSQFVINEMSYTFLGSAVHACPGHWDPQLNWVEGHVAPQEAQIDVFLPQVMEHKRMK